MPPSPCSATRRVCCSRPERAAKGAISSSPIPSSTSTCRGIPCASNSAWAACTASVRAGMSSFSISTRKAPSKSSFCACCTTRSTCSSWWWARWMPSSGRSMRAATSPFKMAFTACSTTVRKLHWNPALGALESPWCESCFGRAHPLFLCDGRVHFLCKSCLIACPNCGKQFCRACQPKCRSGAAG